MPTICIKNFPDDLYEALRVRARENRTSIRAEVLAVLEECVRAEKELKRRPVSRQEHREK